MKAAVLKPRQLKYFNLLLIFLHHSFVRKKKQFLIIIHMFMMEIVSYNWTFGLDGASNDKNTAYIFSSHGIFNVGLLVNSDKGCENILNKEIKINKIGVDFKIPTDVCLEKNLIYFMFQMLMKILCLGIIIGDGFSKNRNISYIIINFDVGLEVVFSCRNDTVMLDVIKAHDFPIADFKVDKLFASEISSEISFIMALLVLQSIYGILTTVNTHMKKINFQVNNPRSYDVSLTALMILDVVQMCLRQYK